MKRKITPKEFLDYAKVNFGQLKNGNRERVLVNTFGCIAKAFHSQVDELIEYLTVFKKLKKELIHFPDKLDYINDTQLFVPDQIQSLNKIRNDLEHRYLLPSREEVQLALGNLEYFMREAQDFMRVPASKLKNIIDKKIDLLKQEIRKISDKERTWVTYELQVQKFVYYFKKNPDALTSKDVDIYLNKMIEENYPAATIWQIHTILKFFFEKVLKYDYQITCKLPKLHVDEQPILFEKDINRILKATPSLKHRLHIKILRIIGLKISKLVNLKISDISKLGLPEEVESELKSYIGDRKSGYIFVRKNGKPFTKCGIQHYFKKLSKRLNLKITAETIRKSNPNIRYKSQIKKKTGSISRKILRTEEIISPSEFKLLIKHARKEIWRDYIYFIYHLGHRDGLSLKQFLNIRREDIDFRKMIIRTAPVQGYQFSKIYIDKKTASKLDEYCKKHNIKEGKLFTYTKRGIQRFIGSVGRKAGLLRAKIGYGVLANSLKFDKMYGKS